MDVMDDKERWRFLSFRDLLLYPFRGLGPVMILYGAVPYLLLGLLFFYLVLKPAGWPGPLPPIGSDPILFGMYLLVSHLPATVLVVIFPGTLMFWAVFFLLATGIKVTVESAAGKDRLSNWPEVGRSEIVRPVLRLLAAYLISFLPGYFLFESSGRIPHLDPPCILILTLEVVYLPMAVLAVTILETAAAANPVNVIRSILRVPLSYAFLVGAMLIFFFLTWIFQLMAERIPYVGRSLVIVSNLYLFILEMRILGLFYRCNRSKLFWFPQTDQIDEALDAIEPQYT